MGQKEYDEDNLEIQQIMQALRTKFFFEIRGAFDSGDDNT